MASQDRAVELVEVGAVERVPRLVVRVANGLPSRFHSRAVLSSEAVSMQLPSDENTALRNADANALQSASDGESSAATLVSRTPHHAVPTLVHLRKTSTLDPWALFMGCC